MIIINKILELKNIYKKINKKEIVKNINLDLNQGEVFGFLGPNGAGKTTTIRMIVGLIKPTSGNIKICGKNINTDFEEAVSNVGCIIESPDMYKFLTGWENLIQYSVGGSNITKSKMHEIVEMVGLKNRINDKVSTYSLGMRQRLGIAQALLNSPKLLILDEPTNGLDPSGISEFRKLIRKLAYEDNIAVFVSSHLINEIQLMCDRVSIIKQGETIKTLNVNELIDLMEVEWIVDNTKLAEDLIFKQYNIKLSQTKKNSLNGKVDVKLIEEINSSLVFNGVKIQYCIPKQVSLEELFLNLTKGDEIV